jgi:hypothetical protein
MKRALIAWVMIAVMEHFDQAALAQSALQLEAKIPLGDVSGRIDHLAVDPARHRLFVAELGNDSVGVVDLERHQTIKRISKLSEPQGVAYLPSLDTLVVANAHDGSVRFYTGAALTPAGQVDLKDDADNVRVLPDGRTIVVGYGSGGLAIIDAATRQIVRKIPLKAHPESFQIDPARARAFVNVPDNREIAVIDTDAGRQVARWKTSEARANFPMALLAERGQVVAAFRSPATLIGFRAEDGAVAWQQKTCGDADDVFHDSRRDRLYVACGDGVVDVLAAEGDKFSKISQAPTVSGARTALFIPALDRLYVAVRAHRDEPAAIWVFKPI